MAGTRVAQLWSAVEIASMRFTHQLAILCSSQSFKTEARKTPELSDPSAENPAAAGHALQSLGMNF